MVQRSSIEWTDYTSNPVKYRDRATGKTVWACVKHSPGCANCYAETLAKRYGRGGPFTKAEMAKVEPYLCDKELTQLLRSKEIAGKRVFVGDMTDVFGEWVPAAILDRLLAALAMRPDVTFQVLTKRADRMAAHVAGMDGREIRLDGLIGSVNREPVDWPPRNVWWGVSVENQTVMHRAAELLKVPAVVRFVSYEPALGPVEFVERFSDGSYRNLLTGQFHDLKCKGVDGHPDFTAKTDDDRLPRINWVIVGGESGTDSRACRVEWVRSLVGQCRTAGVACFVKQLGSVPAMASALDGWPDHVEFHKRDTGPTDLIRLRARKGGDLGEWPTDLRVRQFPEVARP